MALRDWIFRAVQNDTTTSATIATHVDELLPTVAKVASVAVASLENVNEEVITNTSHLATTIEDLLRLHPPLVLGCNLKDVLAHADSFDYEDLRDPEVLKAFSIGLLNLGEIQSIGTGNLTGEAK